MRLWEGLKAGFQAKKEGLNFWKGDGTISHGVATTPVNTDSSSYTTTEEMRADYNQQIGIKDGISLDQVEEKLNTHVSLATKTNLPKGFSLDSNGNMYTVDNMQRTYAGGITEVRNPIFGGRESFIRIAPALKTLPTVELNNIFKHEFMHAWHWSSGLNYKYTELATSSYSLKYSRHYGFDSTSFLQELQMEILNTGHSYYPTNMSYQSFNNIIPSWLK